MSASANVWLPLAVGLGACGLSDAASAPEPSRPAAAAPSSAVGHTTRTAPRRSSPEDDTPEVDAASSRERHAAAHRAIQVRQLGEPLSESPWVKATPLENPGGLASFHAALAQLERADERAARVRVVVYGSSSVAGDRFTGYVRGYLQHRFGDGGPGFVAAVPLWKWHRHQEVRARAGRGWEVVHDLKVGRDGDKRYGLMGVRGQSRLRGARLDLALRPELEPADRWSIWYEARVKGGSFAVQLGDADEVVIDTTASGDDVGPAYAELEGGPASRLRVTHRGGGPVRLHGVVIERDHPGAGAGVVVDELGIGGSGARRVLRWDEDLWTAHLQRRDPDLFVLAYGGIESMRTEYDAARWERDITGVIERFRRAAPDAACLVVAPQDRAHRIKSGRGRRRPVTLDSILKTLRRVALAQGCAYFDTHAMMGGAGSMPRWVDAGLAKRDHVHFTPPGYAHMGRVLVDAIIGSYDRARARDRHRRAR